MCGLVGTFGNILQSNINYFEQALVADYVRGKHSTGVAFVTNSHDVSIRKTTLNPCDFLELRGVSSKLNVSSLLCAIGHNRHATLGGVNQENAHPFEHGNITLAHNGTLHTGVKYKLETKYAAPRFGTDSELICWLFDNYPVDEIIPQLQGAFALTWWDASDNTFNFVRNDEREFTILMNTSSMVWGSEANMVKWITQRPRVQLMRDDSKFFSPKPGIQFKFSYDKGKLSYTTVEHELPKKPEPSVTTYPRYSGGTYNNGYASGYESAWSKKNESGSRQSAANRNGNVQNLPVRNIFEGYNRRSGTDFSKGSIVYGYLKSVEPVANRNVKGMVNLRLTLACDPYTDILIYYVKESDAYNPDSVYGVMVELSGVNFNGPKGAPLLLAENKEDSFTIVASEKDKKEMDDWVEERCQYDDQLPALLDTVHGFENKHITYRAFKEILNKGCAVCSATFDIHSETIDRSCVFISPDDVICKGCSTDQNTVEKYGFSHLMH